MARIAIHVTPKAARAEVCGWRGEELQVRVTVAPEAGKANAAVAALLAAKLGVPKSRVRVVRGQSSRHKAVEVDDVEQSVIVATFGGQADRLF